MPRVPFDDLPDRARVWIFAASRALTTQEAETLREQVDAHLDTWAAHGAPLRSGRELRYDRFLFVAVDESQAGASGCSIDGLVRSVRAAEERLGVTLTDNAPVWFRRGDALHRVSRDEFRRLAAAGEVDPDTIVCDNTITTLGDLRAGRWEVPVRDAWHARAFFSRREAARR